MSGSLDATCWGLCGRKNNQLTILGVIRAVCAGAVLLKEIWRSIAYPVDPWLNNGFQDLNVNSRIDFQSLWKEVRRHHMPFTADNSQNHDSCGNLVCMTVGTSEGSAHSHQSFLLFTFWSWSKFFLSEKNQSMPCSAGCLSLFSNLLDLIKRFSFVASDMNWPLFIT